MTSVTNCITLSMLLLLLLLCSRCVMLLYVRHLVTAGETSLTVRDTVRESYDVKIL